MHSLAKKKLAIMEQDRLDKLLRRVEEQDRRIEKLEREKALARRRHADLRAQESRSIGYRAQWARRNRGGLRTAGVSCMNEYKYSGNRASSAMSSTSDQVYGGMVHRKSKGRIPILCQCQDQRLQIDTKIIDVLMPVATKK